MKPENSWQNNSDSKLAQNIAELANTVPVDEQISTLPISPDFPPTLYQGRRVKAALLLTIIWGTILTLHLLSWGSWVVWSLTGVLWIQAFRVLFAQPKPTPEPLKEENRSEWPFVSLLVAAKNEEAVIGNLVQSICNLDYPRDRYELWVIDDNSTDKTPLVLEQLTKEYSQLKIFRRPPNSTGGKSGALNQVFSLTKGEFVGVFDADAQVAPELLRDMLPLFNQEKVGAVQVQKAIANAPLNFWTRGQEAEMALDSFFQQQRISIGGIGELRGNGQFVRRSALESCGGWNEETITDDLDLTMRLHLDQWDIEFLLLPAVWEEGVKTPLALWHQRNRWAEGGYQRYLDYFPLILKNPMGIGKSWDLLGFWITQYILPTAAIPDLLIAIVRHSLPITTPLTFLTLTLSLVGMFGGLRRTQGQKDAKGDNLLVPSLFVTCWQALRGTVYMLHWFVVMGSVTARISVLPKRLKWVKTQHSGSDSVI